MANLKSQRAQRASCKETASGDSKSLYVQVTNNLSIYSNKFSAELKLDRRIVADSEIRRYYPGKALSPEAGKFTM